MADKPDHIVLRRDRDLDRVRGGLLYTAAFAVRARTDLKKATLVLDPGWIHGMQVNIIKKSG